MDDHLYSPEHAVCSRELAPICTQIVSKILVLDHWKTDLQWTVNMLARSVTKCNKPYNNRLARLISYIKQAKPTDKTVLLETTLRAANLDSFRMLLVLEICKIQDQLQADICANWDHKHLCVSGRSACLRTPWDQKSFAVCTKLVSRMLS